MTLGISTAFSRDFRAILSTSTEVPMPAGVTQCLGKGSSKMERADRKGIDRNSPNKEKLIRKK